MDRRKRYRQIVALMSMLSKTETIDNVDIATFYGNGTNLLSLIVGVDPVQDLHGYDSPWPVGGGVNKWDGTFNTFIPMQLASGTQLCMQAVLNDTSRYIVLRTYDSNQTFLQSVITSTVFGDINYGYMTLSSDASYIRVEKASDITVTNGMLSIGASVKTYSPYSNICPISGRDSVTVNANGTTHTIQLGDTVYGGTLDVTVGTLTVDRAMVTYNGTEPWSYDANYHCVVCGRDISDIETGVTPVDYQNNYGLVCHRPSRSSKQMQVGSATSPIETVATSATEWKVLLQVNPLQIVYPLATPIVIDLDPVQIATIANQINNVWADTGKIIFLEYEA